MVLAPSRHVWRPSNSLHATTRVHLVFCPIMGAKKLKYEDKFRDVEECPPSGCLPGSGAAFRFVQKQLSANDFVPGLVMSPARRHSNMPAAECCSGYGLSMFKSEKHARTRFMALLNKYPQIKKTIGDSLASGTLTDTDGLATKPNKSGHFDLHEFENADLLRKFSVVGPL
jgi:hypothetical protein